MKKTVTLIFLSLLLMIGFTIAQTNVYHHMPDSNAIWRVTYGTGITVDNDNCCNDCLQYQNQISGDTVIGAYTYHKLTKSGVTYYYHYSTACDFSNPTGGFNGYCGAYRDDTSAKKVYVIMRDSSTEALLYDFNLNVGDTIHPVFNLFNCPLITIASIDSILIGNNYRKRWNINFATCGNAASIIEGIGSTFGLFEQLTNFESGGQLVCFSQNDTSLYPSLSLGGCALFTVGLKEVINADETISIFPNPANNTITIRHAVLPAKEESLIISDIFGREIYYQSKSNSTLSTIDISKWNDGVYYWEMISNNGIEGKGKIAVIR